MECNLLSSSIHVLATINESRCSRCICTELYPSTLAYYGIFKCTHRPTMSLMKYADVVSASGHFSSVSLFIGFSLAYSQNCLCLFIMSSFVSTCLTPKVFLSLCSPCLSVCLSVSELVRGSVCLSVSVC